MDLIPPEILLHIFEYIDRPALSETGLHDQPNLEQLTTRPECLCPLKAASLVSRSWRSLVLPRLFRHILWKPRIYSLSAFTLNPIPLLRFLTENNLARSVVTFTLVIDFNDPAAIDFQVAPRIRTADLEWLWDQIFSVIDPLRFTILARPTTLAALLSCMLYLNDAWSFDIPYHILSFARTSRQIGTESGSGTPKDGPSSEARRLASSSTSRSRMAAPCRLFTIRPWTSLLLNEGSSTKVSTPNTGRLQGRCTDSLKVYQVYEFYLRRPPSILGALLGCEEYPNDVPLIPPTVVDFSYIAVFPLASHFETLLEHLPRIDRLFVQLTPKSGHSILDNGREMRHIDPSDLWLERDTSYTLLMRELMLSENPRANWGLLRVFESGDVVDREAWDMIVHFLERSETKEWKVERPGVFAKITGDGQSTSWSDEVNGHIGGSTNQSNAHVL
ncbi:hypothetical protein EKO27_g7501 [Xylaria grammica]|uniref:F-box domain-containing protein n=1 Tax=Xylaria grammica TaxID=363999 RepID=A0A439CZH1_9PEZI|nr:hypothetical protein EKO27_g7501 [Xylaria grammica]